MSGAFYVMPIQSGPAEGQLWVEFKQPHSLLKPDAGAPQMVCSYPTHRLYNGPSCGRLRQLVRLRRLSKVTKLAWPVASASQSIKQRCSAHQVEPG
jgi:hypothetical protein